MSIVAFGPYAIPYLDAIDAPDKGDQTSSLIDNIQSGESVAVTVRILLIFRDQ